MQRFIALLLVCNLSIALQAQNTQLYTTQGTEVIHPNGEKIQLIGTNLGHWLVPEGYMFKFQRTNSPAWIDLAFQQMIGKAATAEFWEAFMAQFITEKDIAYLAEIGVNHLRLPFNYKMLTNETYLGKSYHGFEQMDSCIAWCKRHQLGVMLDMHCAPGGQTGDNIDDGEGFPFLFTDTAAQNEFVEVWLKVSAHYKNEPTVIGYGLVNEPIAHYYMEDHAYLNDQLEPLYKRTVQAIRATGDQHIVILGGAQWNTNFSVFGAPFDDQVIYEFHKYWMPPVQAEIQSYLDFQAKYDVPLYCGETGENTDQWVDSFRTLLDDHRISWAFWPYKKMDNLKGIQNFNKPEGYDMIIDFVEGDRGSYKWIRENRPSIEECKAILWEYIRLSQFSNSYQNTGYTRGLGLKVMEP